MFFARAEIFMSRPAHFLLVRKLLRPAQRVFGSFGNFYELPNMFFAHAKTFTGRPTHFWLMRKFLRAAQRFFCL